MASNRAPPATSRSEIDQRVSASLGCVPLSAGCGAAISGNGDGVSTGESADSDGAAASTVSVSGVGIAVAGRAMAGAMLPRAELDGVTDGAASLDGWEGAGPVAGGTCCCAGGRSRGGGRRCSGPCGVAGLSRRKSRSSGGVCVLITGWFPLSCAIAVPESRDRINKVGARNCINLPIPFDAELRMNDPAGMTSSVQAARWAA